uniref:Uncharacterized protein n=1 Tax=Rhizophora mucronata TaxID=61149 RepID=A0A2P2QTT7_RHIMU
MLCNNLKSISIMQLTLLLFYQYQLLKPNFMDEINGTASREVRNEMIPQTAPFTRFQELWLLPIFLNKKISYYP